jgi:hypothetical protein
MMLLLIACTLTDPPSGDDHIIGSGLCAYAAASPGAGCDVGVDDCVRVYCWPDGFYDCPWAGVANAQRIDMPSRELETLQTGCEDAEGVFAFNWAEECPDRVDAGVHIGCMPAYGR